MATPMSPSTEITPITPGQIGKVHELIGAALRKSGLLSEQVQQVLESQGAEIAEEFVASLRKRVEAISDMIVRHVKVDRSRSPEEVLNVTGRKQYIDKGVVKAMPKGNGEEVDVCFFKIGRYVSDNDLEKEYALRGLVPADLYSLAQVNTDDPVLADDRPNGTHWQDADGNWCFATFDQWYDGRRVDVRRSGDGWSARWWFAGLRK